jgi:hypothetical protein
LPERFCVALLDFERARVEQAKENAVNMSSDKPIKLDIFIDYT